MLDRPQLRPVVRLRPLVDPDLGAARTPAEPASRRTTGGGRLTRRHHVAELASDLFRRHAETVEHLRGDTLALAEQPQEEVRGADVVGAALQRLAQRSSSTFLARGVNGT